MAEVFHKTFLSLDEDGTFAAGASAFGMRIGGINKNPDKPLEVRIDHPFLFAIQHRASGACLFLGQLSIP
jgi:serpin B